MNNNEVADLPIEGAQRLSEALSSSFSIVCGPEDINKPTPGFVQLVMSAFVADMMGIDATHVIRARDALLPSMVYKVSSFWEPNLGISDTSEAYWRG